MFVCACMRFLKVLIDTATVIVGEKLVIKLHITLIIKENSKICKHI